MNFLANLPRFLFFTGKGGVGKTSLACATAIRLAKSGQRVLLVSTDPASNIGQVLGVEIGHRTVPVSEVPGLFALEIDPQQAARLYRERIVDPVRGKLPEAVVRGIEEQLSGACTTEIAAFDSFTSLLTEPAAASGFDHLVFDTAPTGHTLRLLRLPGAWSQFLEEGKGDASCLGPLAGLEKQRSRYREAVFDLSDPERTRLVLVARPQTSSLEEVSRTLAELESIGITKPYLVINGLFPEGETEGDSLARAIVEKERSSLRSIPENLRALPTDRLFLKPLNIVGIPALADLFDPLSPKVRSRTGPFPMPDYPSLETLVDEIEKDGPGLVMLMGKGGVGKTTLASAIALDLARRGKDVLLTTTDPAAHLERTLASSRETPSMLTVDRIDPVAETSRYRAHILETRGANLDPEGRALLEEDLRSPCTEEIAVFQAFSRVLREAEKRFVVIDTAPTGHTLLLLDATGAYHAEIMRQMGRENLRTPLSTLRDSTKTKVLVVTLPETTPVLEAAQLSEDLGRAGIRPWGWIINGCLSVASPRSSFLVERAKNEIALIERVRALHTGRLAVVGLRGEEPVGPASLAALSSHPVFAAL
ncbi:MAG: arsenical pump-driving ATPase [Nitrospiraceae bacterium]|nr:arsenical pump-driving ATPase [Nitrospiraceae bacterium]